MNIKSLWLQRLPHQTQAISSISEISLNNIAEMADKTIAVCTSSEVFSVPINDLSLKLINRNKLEALLEDIAELIKKIDEFSRNSKPCSKSREYGRRTRSKSNSSRYAFCWYHFKFGRNTKKCQLKRKILENQ
ncbi:uncharacterized protein TNIN_116081 [Trichonephila inaurata madagascariensis]|uniref:Uncharacterized protein n=1 Tax=Trichonephila inaurata madagascariensis TaxID=2747483 RepID=A0A8X7BQ41_9ARAC|nr:uncharacterized protein TNIN_116081 [Trichonephila inaurata madagascariensis]